MAYRSEVVSGIAAPNKQALVEHCLEALRQGRISKDTLDKYQVIEMPGSVIMYVHEEDVKWHDEFREVKEHTAFRQDALPEDFGTVFIRTGETIDDVEHVIYDPDRRYDLWCYFGLVRTVSIVDDGLSEPIGTYLD